MSLILCIGGSFGTLVWVSASLCEVMNTAYSSIAKALLHVKEKSRHCRHSLEQDSSAGITSGEIHSPAIDLDLNPADVYSLVAVQEPLSCAL
jgi:hypothetical protein